MLWKSRITLTLFVLCLLFAGCSTRGADERRTQEKRSLHYTCRLKSGEVIATTEREIGDDPSVPKSRVFHRETEGVPFNIEAGESLKEATAEHEKVLKTFQPVLLEQLHKVAEGLDIGEKKKVSVETEPQLDVPAEERNMQLSRVKTFPKEMRYARDAFPHMTASEAKLGASVNLHRALEGRVVSIDEKEVVVSFTPLSDRPLEGPFGDYMIHDKGDHYEIEIDARVGSLVRVGPLVGRISEVGPTIFNIDYSHPFGGERLTCDVAVGPAVDEAQGTVTAGKVSGGASGTETGGVTKEAMPGLQKAEKEKTVGSEAAPAAEEIPEIVQQGDLVEVSCTASMETGEVFWTTRNSVAEDPDRHKVDWYEKQEHCGPETLVAGEQGPVPGLADALLGMRMGEKRRVTVPESKAYGPRNAKWLGEFARVRSIPRTMTIPAESYMKQYGGVPVKDKTVNVNPYVRGRVVEVTEKNVTLELTSATEVDEAELGTTRVKELGDRIELSLTPRIGAPFPFQDRTGRIVAVGDTKFTVDFNHPLAGKPIVLDMEILSLTKASSFRDRKIPWFEDHDKGLDAAAKEKKPVVLVLYAPWCNWSKKLLEESLEDPRIKLLKDSFIWVKVNSDKQKDIKEFYEQKGFPLTLVIEPEGGVISRLEGFKEPEALRRELKQLIDNHRAGPEKVLRTTPRGRAAVAGMVK
jgi:FKBP-type peptidyl-prolyl cis-trans isomerase 2